jgi:hypothetical protein
MPELVLPVFCDTTAPEMHGLSASTSTYRPCSLLSKKNRIWFIVNFLLDAKQKEVIQNLLCHGKAERCP